MGFVLLEKRPGELPFPFHHVRMQWEKPGSEPHYTSNLTARGSWTSQPPEMGEISSCCLQALLAPVYNIFIAAWTDKDRQTQNEWQKQGIGWVNSRREAKQQHMTSEDVCWLVSEKNITESKMLQTLNFLRADMMPQVEDSILNLRWQVAIKTQVHGSVFTSLPAPEARMCLFCYMYFMNISLYIRKYSKIWKKP